MTSGPSPAPNSTLVLHDVAWPGRPHANLDHVLVGPGGVLIVDTKNWSGTVTIDATRGRRCNGYRKVKEVADVEAARQAVLPLVPTVAPTLVAGLICLAAQDQTAVRLDGGTGGTGGIVVVGRAHLLQHVLDLPAVLSTQAVMEVAVSLSPALQRPPNRVPVQATRGAKPAARAGSRKRTARRAQGRCQARGPRSAHRRPRAVPGPSGADLHVRGDRCHHTGCRPAAREHQRRRGSATLPRSLEPGASIRDLTATGRPCGPSGAGRDQLYAGASAVTKS